MILMSRIQLKRNPEKKVIGGKKWNLEKLKLFHKVQHFLIFNMILITRFELKLKLGKKM